MNHVTDLFRRVAAASGVVDTLPAEVGLDTDPEESLFWLLSAVADEGKRVPADLADEVAAVADTMTGRGDERNAAALKSAIDDVRAARPAA